MNYIVVDLEWNQSPNKHCIERKNFPFEIIEIGAFKLDQNRNIVSQFSRTIKPKVYQEIHHKTQEIIHIDIEELNHGDPFEQVIDDFFVWCGEEEYRFCTWGSSDLTEIQRNLEYYGIKGYMDKPIFYYDVQKLFALNYEGKKNAHSLEYAVDYLNLEKKEEFHRAIYDAEYTVKVFQTLEMNIINEYFSIEYYHHPMTKQEEIYVVYDKYSKFISREFASREEALADTDIKGTRCYLCGKKAAKKIRWFTANCKNYYSLAYCRQHGYLKGKIRMKKAANGNVFVVKTIKWVDPKEAFGIQQQRDEVISRRISKRNQKKNEEI